MTPITIDDDAIRMAEELAAMQGTTVTVVVSEALREKWDRDRRPSNSERVDYILREARRIRETALEVDPDWLVTDQVAELYDEHGSSR